MKNFSRLVTILVPYMLCIWSMGVAVHKTTIENPQWGSLFVAAFGGCFLSSINAYYIIKEWRKDE